MEQIRLISPPSLSFGSVSFENSMYNETCSILTILVLKSRLTSQLRASVATITSTAVPTSPQTQCHKPQTRLTLYHHDASHYILPSPLSNSLYIFRLPSFQPNGIQFIRHNHHSRTCIFGHNTSSHHTDLPTSQAAPPKPSPTTTSNAALTPMARHVSPPMTGNTSTAR